MDEKMETAAFDTMEEALESAWSDEDSVETVGSVDTPADQPEWAEEAAPAPEDGEGQRAADQPREGGEAKAATPELFTLRNREEQRQVTREELIAMAQKGWDYDTVRAERDRLRAYRQEADPAMEMVKAYAQRSGMSIPDYLDYCRKQELMHGGMDERTADQTLRLEKQQAALRARQVGMDGKGRQQSVLERAKEQQAQRRQDMERFLRVYPGVKAETIPKEVWQKVVEGTPLVSAYAMAENERLKAELAAERQNTANRQRTPGALGGNVGRELDEIDRLWAEED